MVVPKPTFFNLPAEKRDAIVELSLSEFGAHPYHQASLSRIVEQAGIAKGSIYQYFEGKLDLYRWLLTEEVPRRRMAAAGGLDAVRATPPEGDFATLLREMVHSGVRFMLDNPVLVGVLAPITQPTSDPELRALYRDVRSLGHGYFVTILAGFRDAGQIRSDIDVDLIARVVGLVLGSGLPELVRGHTGLGIEELVARPKRGRRLDDGAIAELVGDTVDLLLGGIAPRR